MNDKKQEEYKYPYSDEWLKQHKEYQFKRLLEEIKRREEEENNKIYIVRVFNKIKSKIIFYWMGIKLNIRMIFDKELRELVEKARKEKDRIKQKDSIKRNAQ